MLFYEYDRKNSTSKEFVYPLNEYYFYHISDNTDVSRLNIIYRAGFIQTV